jgi:nitroreductase
VDEEHPEPGLESIGVPEGRELAPGGDEGALQRVLGEVGVAQDPRRDRVHPVAGLADQPPERFAVAPHRPLDGVSHAWPPPCRTGVGAVAHYEGRGTPNVQAVQETIAGAVGGSRSTRGARDHELPRWHDGDLDVRLQPREASMEFRDVVMKRRAVRRFEEGGVDPAIIEGIARLAQRTPSAGFSQGQRLIVVTDREVRRRVARACGEEEYAAQFIPCVSEEIYHRRYREPDKVDDEGHEIDWPVPYWHVDIGATMMVIMLAAVDAGLASGFAGAFDPVALRAELGIPAEFVPIGVMPVGRPLPDVRSPSLKRGWVPFDEFARFERWG